MSYDFYKNLGRNIKARRKVLGLTQQQLADKMDISLNFMGKIEVAFSKPSLDTLIEFADALETTVSDLTKFNICLQLKLPRNTIKSAESFTALVCLKLTR